MKTYRVVIEHYETRRETIDVDAEGITLAVVIATRYAESIAARSDRRVIRIVHPRKAIADETGSVVVSAKEVG